ncbi:MAG TPA: 2-C-methyl-D-erythritol 4-phosphate cytidylyltransferase [Coriobacteriia bacterium]|nr:2-C-methyl-D-erythritol 4-phosphate cytidylyltransferase [Coriobacteriia bacterium]
MRSRDSAVVLVAGGTAERFGSLHGKQMVLLAGKPLLAHALRASLAVDRAGLVIVVCPPGRVDEYASVLATAHSPTDVRFVAGGERRQDSVANGIAAVTGAFTYIAVHDGARPLAGPELFADLLALLDAMPGLVGAVVGHPSVDTLKRVDGAQVTSTPDRSKYWMVQTPQAFRAAALRDAYALAEHRGWDCTDDASLVEAAGGAVGLLEGPRDNIKVTYPEDLAVAEALLAGRGGGGS